MSSCHNITEEINGTSIGPGRPFINLLPFPMDFLCALLVLSLSLLQMFV